MEEFEFIECLNEMTSVRPKGGLNKLGILLAVNPDDDRDGDPYFKMYDKESWTSASKVWRIRFDRPEFIKKHKGKIPAATTMNSSDKKILLEYLNLSSKDFDGTVWDELKYRWNIEKGLMDQFGFNEYKQGIADKFYSKKDTKNNYIPFSLNMPNYDLLP